jgi:hypothetical protein
MRIRNEHIMFDPSATRGPWDEYGLEVPWAGFPLKNAPLMSRYTCITSGSQALYIKVADTGAATDWVVLARAGGTVSGDLTITGTITAGDVVIQV